MGACSVPGCSNRTGRGEAVKFYLIPALRENTPVASKEKYWRRRVLWLSKLGKSDLLFENTSLKVCSRHFLSGKPSTPLDIDNADLVPSLHMPGVSVPDSDHSDHEEPLGGQGPAVGQGPISGHDSSMRSDDMPPPDYTQRSDQANTADEMNPSSFSEGLGSDVHGQLNSTFCDDMANENSLPNMLSFSDISVDEGNSVLNQGVNSDTSVTDNAVSDSLQIEYSKLLKSYDKLRDEFTELEVDKFEMSKSISDLEDKSASYEQKSMTFETSCNEINDVIKVQADRMKELEGQLEAANDIIHGLKEDVKKYASCSITLDRLKNDEKFIQFYSDLSSYKIFDIILKHVTNHVTNATRSLQPWQCLLLTLMRLRMGVPLQDLAFRFGISLSTASRIFEKWLYWLYIYLSPFINWPDRETLRLTMPNSFKEEFGNTIAVIIDCFEFFTERPGALDSRAMTWSKYKHHNTVKYLIGTTPLGAVSFISEGWGGRVSDKHITSNSGLYEKLLPGDVVMADRGFLIGEDLGFLCAKLLIPAFTKSQAQLSSHDISDTRKIASLRVHVERVIGLVKNKYRIMKSVLPSEFLHKKQGHTVPQIDEIVRVCCALTNISPGIVTK